MKELSSKALEQFIKDRITETESKRQKQETYKKYYDGEHLEILSKEQKVDKPSNIIVFNFCELIIETNHSYLFGLPLTFTATSDDEKTARFKEELDKVFFLNENDAVVSSLGKTSAIYGEAIEVMYIDEERQIRFQETDPKQWVFFEFLGQECALRAYTTTEYVPKGETYETIKVEKFEIYTPTYISRYEKRDGGKLEEIKTIPHFFGELPVIQYKNKSTFGSEGVSDLKNVINLNDAYNKTASAAMDVIETNADPYLLLVNLGVDPETVQEMREKRILQFRSDSEMPSEAKFLFWDNNIQATEQFLNRLATSIFLLSFTPNMFDNQGKVDTESGESLKVKFFGSSDVKANGKILAFKKGLKKKVRLIAKQLSNASNSNYLDVYQNIEVTFNKNVPTNLTELLESLAKAMGFVSHKTLLGLLPNIENPEEELERIKEEQGTPITFDDDEIGV